MSVKGKLGIIISACVVVSSALFWYVQKEPYSTETVMESLWEEYDVQSTMIGGEDTEGIVIPTLWVDVYDKDDISGVEKYLEKNLSRDDLKYYEIDVFPYEELTEKSS